MIVVDSSVWIAHLRDSGTPEVQKLRALDDPSEILIGDLILLEMLQGARSGRHAALIEQNLRQFEIATMLSPALASKAARNYRVLRDGGVTVRKTVDLIIGTFCIEGGHRLLHADRDFDPIVERLGLGLA
ncbi:MAG TPA: PIN domain nuclease [Beijerinckiaceae bacterium]|nr:PIN domain nuclease [Beijerinckiaceae bacterium]